MIAAAIRRNKEHIESGRAEFHVADVLDFDPGSGKFDKIFAVRIGLFHRDPTLATTLLGRWLAPRGRLLVVYDEP